MTSPWHALLDHPRYPRASTYDPEWVMKHQMGPNALWLAEAVCDQLDLQPGQRVLDLGCGKAMSSVFLAREFGVEVWAADLWINPTENWRHLRETDEADRIHPIHAEAHDLPFPNRFFDVVVSFDAYQYFGTDDLYLGYLSRFVKRGGQLGIGVAGFNEEPAVVPPPELAAQWVWDMVCWHSPQWWRRHWERSGLVDVKEAGVIPEGRDLWAQWEQAYAAASGKEGSTALLDADVSRLLALLRMTATTRT